MPPADREDETVRRSVVPPAAGRSLWLAAVWTGVGAAVVCATLAIVVVAICWLPVSQGANRTNSTIRAGLLSFLASVHGGITVDDTHALFLPLGMLLAVGVTAWRAGCGLADVADSLDEQDPVRLLLAGLAQTASFVVVCLFAVPFAELGTSSIPFLGVGCAAFALFALTGGVAFTRWSALSEWAAWWLPQSAGRWARAAAAAVAGYLVGGALLVTASLVVHHADVETLSRQVGGGWGGVPILLLGILSAPNAVIAASAYLAGPGLTVGSGTTASLFGTAHGTLPAFPIFAAMPSGHGPTPATWGLVVATPLLAGLALARVAARAPSWPRRIADVAASAVIVAVVMAVLGWQGGGAIGDGRLHTIGASPWQLGAATAAESAAVAAVAFAVTALAQFLKPAPPVPVSVPRPRSAGNASRLVAVPTETADAAEPREADEKGKLAG
jgi:hypothetical protein